MKRLVQRVFDINPSIMSDSVRLQSFFTKMSEDNWEYCGQVGIFYVFKRWEEEPNVVNGGSSSFRQQPQQSSPYFGQYNPPSYQPQSYQPPYQSPYGGYGSYNRYNPQNFGVRVDESDKYDRYTDDNPFNQSPHE